MPTYKLETTDPITSCDNCPLMRLSSYGELPVCGRTIILRLKNETKPVWCPLKETKKSRKSRDAIAEEIKSSRGLLRIANELAATVSELTREEQRWTSKHSHADW